MGLEINTIENVKLQKLAKRVDNGDGTIDQNEIGKLLIKMAKKKYNSDDLNSILGLETSNLNNKDKLAFYENCLQSLEESMPFSERAQKISEQADDYKKNKRTIIGGFAGASALLTGSIILNAGVKSLAMSALKFLAGAAAGAGVGAILAIGANIIDKKISEEQQERLETKESYIANITEKLNELKEV